MKEYIASNQERFLAELFEWLRIPSVSADSRHKGDVRKAAEFLKEKFYAAGIEKVEICETKGHPIVYAEKISDPALPTILVYGHYDVQPVDPVDLWDSPPFEPVVKNGKIYARGATDDKGQMFMHVKSVQAFFKTMGSLPLNVKFLIEGEEEIGSEHLESFVNFNIDMLKCDAVLISDTALFKPDTPTLTYGLRGLCYMEVEVTGPNRDLHSGSFGGAVANPLSGTGAIGRAESTIG